MRLITILRASVPAICNRAVTDAQRQACHGAARAAGTPVIRIRRPADHRIRACRWHNTVAVLAGLQAEYVAWLKALPSNLQDSAFTEALQEICDLDLGELQAIEPPRGFGRD